MSICTSLKPALSQAIRFLRANAALMVWTRSVSRHGGSSAGAHLASLAALSNRNAALEGSVGNNLGTSSAVQLAVVAVAI